MAGVSSVCAWPKSAAAQIDPTFLVDRVVRIVVEGGPQGASAASGFLWLTPDQVVTSLHALSGDKITVECHGVKRPATVAKVLERADLALLNTSGLGSCSPFGQTEADPQKPPPNAPLATYGYHGGARSGTSRAFTKQLGNPETLEGLVAPGPVLEALRRFNIPATNLDVYYVQGGLLPGYSGAPVVDSARKLVGIVDGGLDKGQSDYNWVIPVRYLNDLLASGEAQVPSQVPASSAQHFSVGIAEPDASSVLQYGQGELSYQWVKTKTRSLSELARTSDDPEGLNELLATYLNEEGRRQAGDLLFDIYEDQDQGLIIALPSGQRLEIEQAQGGYWLTSKAEDPSGQDYASFLDFQQVAETFQVGQQRVGASDPGYFERVIADIEEQCEKEHAKCVLDSNVSYTVDFENDSKILKAGFTVDYEDPSTLDAYDYYSYAVRAGEDVAFRAYARFWPRNGLFACTNPQDDEACDDALALTQLSQMVGVHLTTFADLVEREAGAGQPEVTIGNASDDRLITDVRASSAGAQDWGENLVSDTVSPQDYVDIPLEGAACKLDFKAVFDDGREEVTGNVDVCKGFPVSSAFFFHFAE